MSSDSLADNLREHVLRLARDIGERNVHHPHKLQASEEYIRGVFQQLGYAVRTQAYLVDSIRCANLEVSRRGSLNPEALVLVGAHYDTVRHSPGANDNGSGVAVLLELARALRASQPERTLRLVAFVNEEMPFFYTRNQGSQVYARAARARGDDIRLMLSLETMGYYRDEPQSQGYPPLFRLFYPDRGNFIALVSNFRSRGAMRRLARAFRAVSDFPLEHVATFAFVPGVAWSDHLSFWREGYRAVMVTDTAFYRYPFYHSAEDTPEKLDYRRLAEVTRGLHRALCRLSTRSL
ncbi:MAG: M20/M25/M40 family metallo-hydrolase [Gammaproteobacteria bacterium]|jgi:Zn-dependent M28 family amino/carboxypeptidase